MRRPTLGVIWLTVFLDLVGFGIVVPLVPLLGRDWGAHGFVLGLIIASYSALQFFCAPLWGRWSDRVGRRPALLISTAGAAVSYVCFALSTQVVKPSLALALLALSRALAGACGGNITVAQAYIADITPAADRSQRMGLIGMAFGLGFILGPMVGAMSLKWWGWGGPGWVAAALCGLNFVLAWAILVESRRPGTGPVVQRPHWVQYLHTLRTPKVGLLVMVFFLATFAFSCFESTLPLVVSDNFGLNLDEDNRSAATVVCLFAYCGILGAVLQGGAVGRLVRWLGEVRLIVVSLVCTACSLAMLPFIRGDGALSWALLMRAEGAGWWALLAALALLSVGSSLTRPPLLGLISNLTHESEQGATLGVAQGLGSLARVLGPIFANTTLHYLVPLPYLACSVLLLLVAALLVRGWGGRTPMTSAKPVGEQPSRAEVDREAAGF
ncbi:MAG: MFS transporter [Verrucomicrobiota bacterium]|nr:MFS transporter [Limisphaera sp.]MDW8383083.1 MFS transporter [Verrucomicrobiota bacterium]